MRFASPLQRGVLVSRYKRFFADIRLDDGVEITAHCPNPGSMLGLNRPGLGAWVSRADDPARKLAWTLEMIETDGGALAGVNTLAPNRLVAEALAANAIPDLTGYPVRRREVRMGEASRVDFVLEAPDRPRCWLEVKNCHLSRAPGLAEFPDCVAARSAKHLRELESMAAAGDRAVALFVVQRADCEAFAACRDLDPAFAAALDHAADAGVEVLAWACAMSPSEITIVRPLPIRLGGALWAPSRR